MDKMQTTSIGGGKISFVDEGDGPPILFVHGFPLSHAMWQEQINFFKHCYRVICPDLPGFGRSESMDPSSGATLTMEALADWLVDFLGAIECESPVHFCGLSMGGYIGWQFCKRHPTRVRSIIACNTRAGDDMGNIRRGREIAARQVMVTGSKPIADAMVQKLFFQHRPGLTETSFYNQIHEVISSTDPASIAAGQRGMAKRENVSAWLSKLGSPVFFVAGQHDQITPADEMQQNASLVENAEYALIPNAGHVTPVENAPEFNSAVESFLGRFD